MSDKPVLLINEDNFNKEKSIIIKYMKKLSSKEASPIEVISIFEDLGVISYTEGINYDDIIKAIHDKLNPSLFEKVEEDTD